MNDAELRAALERLRKGHADHKDPACDTAVVLAALDAAEADKLGQANRILFLADSVLAEKARADAAEAQVAALLEALTKIANECNDCQSEERWGVYPLSLFRVIVDACDAVADLSAAAAEHDSRIRREAVEADYPELSAL
jgi:hypothetical protein